MRYVLLLRAVNLGPTNKLAMADLRALLEDLGCTDVKTVLNSGNAVFDSTSRSVAKLAAQVEDGLRGLGLDVRACVRRQDDVARMVDRVPDLPGYVTVNVLFDKPSAAALKELLATDWSPEVVEAGDGVLYIGFHDAARTKLTVTRIEKALGVGCTARTPATLRKLL